MGYTNIIPLARRYRSYERFYKIFLFVGKRTIGNKDFHSLADPVFGSIRFPLCRIFFMSSKMQISIKVYAFQTILIFNYAFQTRLILTKYFMLGLLFSCFSLFLLYFGFYFKKYFGSCNFETNEKISRRRYIYFNLLSSEKQSQLECYPDLFFENLKYKP